MLTSPACGGGRGGGPSEMAGRRWQRTARTRAATRVRAAIAVAVMGVALLLVGRASPVGADPIGSRRDAPIVVHGATILYPAVSDRFGVGVNRQFGAVDRYDVASLRAGWYVDWATQLSPAFRWISSSEVHFSAGAFESL